MKGVLGIPQDAPSALQCPLLVDGPDLFDWATHDACCSFCDFLQSVLVHPPEVAEEAETVVSDNCLYCSLVEPPEDACAHPESSELSKKEHLLICFLHKCSCVCTPVQLIV